MTNRIAVGIAIYQKRLEANQNGATKADLDKLYKSLDVDFAEKTFFFEANSRAFRWWALIARRVAANLQYAKRMGKDNAGREDNDNSGNNRAYRKTLIFVGEVKIKSARN